MAESSHNIRADSLTDRHPQPSHANALHDSAGASSSTRTSAQNNTTPTAIIVSKEKRRFINANSAVALPHIAGREIAASDPPRLHSYAWNLGIRPEKRGRVATSLSDFLTHSEWQQLMSQYFTSVHPLVPFLSQESIISRANSCWDRLETEPNVAAVVSGVALLGSFFSATPHPREEGIKMHCFSLLDTSLSNAAAMVDIDSVAGWILRTLFVRLTTRPAMSCLASHISMHTAEILSLHRDLTDISSSAAGKEQFTKDYLDSRRRHYLVAWFLNQLLSREYGVAPVALPNASSSYTPSGPDSSMDHIIAFGRILEASDDAGNVGMDSKEMASLFVQLSEAADTQPVVALFRADVGMSLLRKFLAAGSRPNQMMQKHGLGIMNSALESIPGLISANHTWWNLLGLPFQLVCVSVAFDTNEFLSVLPAAMEKLRLIADRFDTHMAKEALSTAQQLVAASKERTASRLALKDTALSHAMPAIDEVWMPMSDDFDILGEWPLTFDFLGTG